MKKYNKPNIETFVISSIDVIATSESAALNNIAQNLAVENARTQAYDFNDLFGE